jgi:hypothetical protein
MMHFYIYSLGLTMATKNPRISVMLKPSTSALLIRVGQLTKQSQSAMIAEIIESTEPVFERLITVLEAAQLVSQDLKDGTKKSLEVAEQKLHEQLGFTLAMFDEVSAPIVDAATELRFSQESGKSTADSLREPQGSGGVHLPPHVTRGSHTPKISNTVPNSPMKKALLKPSLKKASSTDSKLPQKPPKQPTKRLNKKDEV